MEPTTTWALFLTTHSILVAEIESTLKAQGLPPLIWYDVLWALERAPEHRLRMLELADYVVLSRSNLTRLVDRLEEAKLVGRVQASDDKRGSYAELLPAGLLVRKRMWPVYQSCIENFFSAQFSKEEDALLKNTLRRILISAKARRKLDAD